MADHDAASILTLDIERKGDMVVVRCHGRLVSEVSRNFHGRICQLIPEYKRIVLDLCDLTNMDSMGLGTLARLYVTAKSKGCSLELAHLGKQIRELLGMTHMLGVFTVLGEKGVTLGF
jgi:anti-sigma B factor antagonist